MKYPFRFRRYYNKLFPSSEAASIRQLRQMMETSRNSENKSSLLDSINKAIYNNSRSIQSSNLRGIRNGIFNSLGVNQTGDSFIESLIINNFKNLLNNELQSSFFGSERRISPINFSENQIASQLLKMMQKGKRNL